MKTLLALAIPLVFASCATISPPAPKGSIDHVVLMWQKRPGNAADRAALIAACEKLRAVPGIRSLHTGTALPSDRPIVDDSFDVGLTVRFDSAADLAAYGPHPLHLKQKDEVLVPLTRKILVYDIVR
ncbi:MAG: Dabb family protein [Verrucomicrobiota bacterium]